MNLPFSAAALQARWPQLRRHGLFSFMLSYGIARYALTLAGGVLGARLAVDGLSFDWGRALLSLVPILLAGGLWSWLVWNTCEKEFDREKQAEVKRPA